MSYPNLFIVGAPKCGTTALAEYLGEHPQVHMAPIKEPHYFTYDMPGLRETPTEETYLRLFANARPECRYRGEASVFYLYSEVAIAEVLQHSPAARLIVMLRDPLAMIPSLYAQQVYALAENAPDLGTAWRLQEERQQGKSLPPLCVEPRILQYREVARLGAQLERFYAVVPPWQRHVILFEDFARQPAQAYADVLQFLDLPHDGRQEFPKVNARGAIRSHWLQWLLYRHRIPASARWAGRKVGLHHMYDMLRALNTRPAEKCTLGVDLQLELRATFRDDVARLSQLLKRDLSKWLAA